MYDAIQAMLPSIVESMLPTFSDKLALRVVLRLEIDHYSELEDQDLHATRYVEYIFHRVTNYTRVYMRQAENSRDLHIQPGDHLEYERTSDHDSCWRTDGLRDLPQIYFEMRRPFEERGLGWRDIHERGTFDLFGGGPHYLLIEDRVALDTENMFPKRYMLDLGKQVPIYEIHNYLRIPAQKAKT